MRSFEVLTHFLFFPRQITLAPYNSSYCSRHTNTVYRLKLSTFKSLYAKRKVPPKTCEHRGTNLGQLSFILKHFHGRMFHPKSSSRSTGSRGVSCEQMNYLPCSMKILREFYFTDWRSFVVCGNKLLRFEMTEISGGN